MCSIILGQYGSNMRARLESSNNWDNISKNKDEVGLKDAIKSFCYHSSTNRHLTITSLKSRIRLCSYKQQDNQAVQDCVKEIRDITEVMK